MGPDPEGKARLDAKSRIKAANKAQTIRSLCAILVMAIVLALIAVSIYAYINSINRNNAEFFIVLKNISTSSVSSVAILLR